MNPLAFLAVLAVILGYLALVAALTTGLKAAARRLCRRGDGEPLTRDEARCSAAIRRGWKQTAPGPAYDERRP